MADARALLTHQSRWQKRLTSLSWPAKMRMAAEVRKDVLAFRRAGGIGASRRASVRPGPGDRNS